MNDTQSYAFPSDPAGYQPQQGLTKREEFAKAAMQGMLANQATARGDIAKVVAHEAVEYADALLAKLNAQPK